MRVRSERRGKDKKGMGKEERVGRRGKVWRKRRNGERIRVWGEERVGKENNRMGEEERL